MNKYYFEEYWREVVMQVRLEKLAKIFGIKELDFTKENYIESITKIHEAIADLKPERVEAKEQLTPEESDQRVYDILGL